MSNLLKPVDLSVTSFLILRSAFFGPSLEPRPYKLRDKRNTQDDPFDEHVRTLLAAELPDGVACVGAPGPLITPDLVVARPQLCNESTRKVLAKDATRILAIEVKKLERTRGDTVARASGLDYNTTPPCGKVRVYAMDKNPLDISGFYLFVCQEAVGEVPGRYCLSALTLCHGNLLNADFDLYLSIVGDRTKRLGLGTYGDGVNRNRPMLIFSNPLGVAQLDRRTTLIHERDDLQGQSAKLRMVGVIRRTTPEGSDRVFHCYRVRDDVSPEHEVFDLSDPFPSPTRVEATQHRGRFRVNIHPVD